MCQVEAAGVDPQDFIPIQPIFQHAIWSRTEGTGRQAVDRAVETAKAEVPDFHLDGGSWTNHISWEEGYENVLNPMEQLSAKFHRTLDGKDVDPSSASYRSALLHLLVSQTSCFRYWGQGRWTDYAREICRRGTEILESGF